MIGRRAAIVSTLLVATVTVARSGHELPIYPSYYPHEIELTALSPTRAAELLLAGKIQAHVGGAPRFAEAPPNSIASVESFGSFVIVRANSDALGKDKDSACNVTRAAVRLLAEKRDGFVFHPYPVTPLHGDYLHHVDLAETAKLRAMEGGAGPDPAGLRLRVGGETARSLIDPARITASQDWEAEIIEIDVAELIASASYAMNGWLGPPAIRAGWFHAALLFGDRTAGDAGSRLDRDAARLRNAEYADLVERLNLERSLVAALTENCAARVAGYTVKREYYSTVFTAGVENLAYDALTGFNSPMFLRTVKLKDFPWNGWLALGVNGRPDAAWNPIAGFSDGFGSLLWSAVGDPALIPSPNEAAWMLNRITEVQPAGER